ncbi:MAG: Gx transporter family protein [Clostridia bacterium]|nr:Gx transporter family protein [Clostridia bacterium]MBR0444236.1 Gx transporter family protein [Clostridia bacterium]
MTRSQSKNTGRIARLAVLTAMALALQWLETLLPPPVPAVPVRIGLANIFVLYAMMEMTPGDALAVSVLRSLLLPLITGNVSGLLYSLCGGVLSWIAMTVLLGSYRRGRISSIGLSVAGAAAFQIGQVLAGCFIVGTVIFAYAPVMILLSVPAGIATGWISGILVSRVSGKIGKRA